MIKQQISWFYLDAIHPVLACSLTWSSQRLKGMKACRKHRESNIRVHGTRVRFSGEQLVRGRV